MTQFGSAKIRNHRDDTLHILHLEDSALDHDLVARTLTQAGHDVHLTRVETLDDLQRALDGREFDVLLADYRLPGFTALDAWEMLQRHTGPVPPCVLLSGAIGEATAVAAIQQGISDFVSKDDLSRLPAVLDRVREMQRLRQAKRASDAALEHSRLQLAQWADHLQASIEQERAAIAREIHDDIGSALTAVRFDLAWLVRHSIQDDMTSHAVAAQEQLQLALDASQRIMLNLRPAVLDQGLAAAVQWLADGFARRTGIRVQCHITLTELLDKRVELVAYRATQEALTNISKHAHCTMVTIDATDKLKMLTVEISDNGQGIATQPNQRTSGRHGLIGLQERARTVGGWLDVSSQPGQGTSIILSVPLSAPDAEPEATA